MLGFVFAGRMAIRLPFFRSAPRTLEEEVKRRDLQVLPLDRVRAFQKRSVEDYVAQGPYYFGKWKRVPADQISALNPPVDVARDIAAARKIRGAKVYAEQFEGDPFVFVEKRSQGRLELVCFGSWDAPGFVA